MANAALRLGEPHFEAIEMLQPNRVGVAVFLENYNVATYRFCKNTFAYLAIYLCSMMLKVNVIILIIE